MSETKTADIATEVKFCDVCRMLEKIQKAKGSRQKEITLEKYLESFKRFSQEFRAKNGGEKGCDYSFYPVLRCLLPGTDNARGSYGIQLTTMAKLYIKVLNLAPNGEDAKKLNHTTVIKGCSDYADVVHAVMQNRSREKYSTLSLFDIHQLLDIIAKNDRRKTEVELTKFIEVASPIEQKWLIRIILKKMRLELGEQKIFSLYHPLAKEFYARTTDLKRVCECVDSGKSIDISDTVQPHQYIRPMLCEKSDLSKFVEMLNESAFFMETKMDGERFQIHVLDEKYKFISRNGKDYTSNFGSSVAEGNLTPLIAKLFTINVHNMILDGEMMVWDRICAGFRVKGENIDVKSLHSGGPIRPCFVAYDILYLNGISHVDKPYVERVTLLEKIVKEQPGVLMLCKRTKIRNKEELIRHVKEAIDAKEEGVVIKVQNSVYKPGVRNGGWYKIKPDYIKGLTEEFDLLIIGGYYNRTRSYIDSYELGVYKKTTDDTESPLFYSVAKVGQGLSNAERQKLNESLKPHCIDVDKRNKNNIEAPSCIEWGSDVPDFWIDPTKSTVLQIKATELTESSSFRTPYTLRFPRIETIRYDKPWYDSMTFEEYKSLYKNVSGVAKINKRSFEAADLLLAKRLKLSPVKKRISNNNPYASVFRASDVTKICDICDGLQFCILSTSHGKPTIDQLKAMAVRYGGKIVENPSLDSKKCICIAGDRTGRVQRLIATGLYNIVSIDWMIRSFNNEQYSTSLAQPKPRDMLCMTPDMEEEFKLYYDKYGDSYTDVVDVNELEIIMKSLNADNLPKLLDRELVDLENLLFGESDIKNIFRMLNGCFYAPDIENLPNILIIAKLIFQSKGGCNMNSDELKNVRKMGYVFIDRANVDSIVFSDWMHANFSNKYGSRLKVLSYSWILDCDKRNTILDVTDYLFKE